MKGFHIYRNLKMINLRELKDFKGLKYRIVVEILNSFGIINVTAEFELK